MTAEERPRHLVGSGVWGLGFRVDRFEGPRPGVVGCRCSRFLFWVPLLNPSIQVVGKRVPLFMKGLLGNLVTTLPMLGFSVCVAEGP